MGSVMSPLMESARLPLDALAGQISTDLLRLNPDDLDAELKRSLRQIVEALDAEQATLLSFADHDELFEVVSWWARQGKPAPDAADGPLTMQIVGLLHGDQVRIVRIPDDLAAPPFDAHDPSVERVRSAIAVPVRVAGRRASALIITCVRDAAIWSD